MHLEEIMLHVMPAQRIFRARIQDHSPLHIEHQDGAQIGGRRGLVEQGCVAHMRGGAHDFGVVQPIDHGLQRQRIEFEVPHHVVFGKKRHIARCLYRMRHGIQPTLVENKGADGRHRKRNDPPYQQHCKGSTGNDVAVIKSRLAK